MYVNFMSMHYHCCILVLELVICGNLRCIFLWVCFFHFWSQLHNPGSQPAELKRCWYNYVIYVGPCTKLSTLCGWPQVLSKNQAFGVLKLAMNTTDLSIVCGAPGRGCKAGVNNCISAMTRVYSIYIYIYIDSSICCYCVWAINQHEGRHHLVYSDYGMAGTWMQRNWLVQLCSS